MESVWFSGVSRFGDGGLGLARRSLHVLDGDQGMHGSTFWPKILGMIINLCTVQLFNWKFRILSRLARCSTFQIGIPSCIWLCNYLNLATSTICVFSELIGWWLVFHRFLVGRRLGADGRTCWYNLYWLIDITPGSRFSASHRVCRAIRSVFRWSWRFSPSGHLVR